jgi:hypothetical protein
MSTLMGELRCCPIYDAQDLSAMPQSIWSITVPLRSADLNSSSQFASDTSEREGHPPVLH